jgi:hypothetical protein
MRAPLIIAALLLTSGAYAAKPVRTNARAAAPVAPPEPVLPAPSITLTLTAPAPDVPWTMRVENTGTVPLRLVADARLLSFEVTAPGAKKSVKCALPADMRPHTDEERGLVVPPGRAYVEKLDPRIFCFGARAAAAMAPGAEVVAHLGWPLPAPRPKSAKKPARITGPYAVSPIEGLDPAVAAAKEIVASAVTIGTPPVATKEARTTPRTLAVSSPAFLDYERSGDVSVPVTIANETASAKSFLLRSETIAFDVSGPTGIGVTDPSPTVRCASDMGVNTSIREVFTTLGAKGRTSLGILLKRFCPEHTFDHAGIYLVRPKLDTRNASGAGVGLRTFDGEATSDGATQLRIRQEAIPFTSRRPTLE